MPLIIIAAVASNGVIGSNNKLPFDLPTDRKRFKELTGNDPVVMGSKTFFSLPDRFRPLPNRENIVLTRDKGKFSQVRGITISDFETVLKRSKTENVWVIGGSEIYALALPHAQIMYMTNVHADLEGDTIFPSWNADDWIVIHSEDERGDRIPYTLTKYHRKNPFIEMANIRTETQRKEMLRITEAGHCPFCLENLKLYHHNPILWSGVHWIVSTNDYPYPDSRIHLILILKTHTEDVDRIPSGAYEEIGTILRWAKTKFEIPGGGLYMRFGECTWNSGTIRHSHAHIVVKNRKDTSVKFYL